MFSSTQMFAKTSLWFQKKRSFGPFFVPPTFSFLIFVVNCWFIFDQGKCFFRVCVNVFMLWIWFPGFLILRGLLQGFVLPFFSASQMFSFLISVESYWFIFELSKKIFAPFSVPQTFSFSFLISILSKLCSHSANKSFLPVTVPFLDVCFLAIILKFQLFMELLIPSSWFHQNFL